MHASAGVTSTNPHLPFTPPLLAQESILAAFECQEEEEEEVVAHRCSTSSTLLDVSQILSRKSQPTGKALLLKYRPLSLNTGLFVSGILFVYEIL